MTEQLKQCGFAFIQGNFVILRIDGKDYAISLRDFDRLDANKSVPIWKIAVYKPKEEPRPILNLALDNEGNIVIK